METKSQFKLKDKFLLVIKRIAAAVFFSLAIVAIIKDSILALLMFTFAGVLVLPRLKHFWIEKFSFLQNRGIKLIIVIIIHVIGVFALSLKKPPLQADAVISNSASKISSDYKGPYADYIIQHQKEIANLSDSAKLHRDTMIRDLTNNQNYIDIVLNKKVEAKYVPLINLINDGIITLGPKGFQLDFEQLEPTDHEKRMFCYGMVLLNSCGGYTTEQVEAFERYRKKYGYYSPETRVFYNTVTKTEETVPKFNFTPVFSILNPYNKIVANSIYEAVSQGLYNWDNKNKEILFYIYLSNRIAYNEYLKIVDPESPYIYYYDMQTTAEKLAAAYNYNEVAADKVFKNKRTKLTGKVMSINKDFTGKAYIILSGGDSFFNIHCTMVNKNDAAKIEKGYRYTITGTCTGMLLNSVVLNKCEVE